MKNFNFTWLLLLGVAVMFACHRGTDKANASQGTPDIKGGAAFDPFADTVSLATATAAISRYSTWSNGIATCVQSNTMITCLTPTDMPSQITRAFRIHSGDFLGVLGITAYDDKVKGARTYLGIHNGQLHLYFTPLDRHDNDSIPRDANGNLFVYDLTTPCPNTCDNANSPLNAAFFVQKH